MSGFHMANSGPWSLGTLIWLPACVVLIAALIYCSRRLYRFSEAERGKRYGSHTEAKWFARVCVGAIVSLVIGTFIGMYPYKAEYHQWRDVSGTVEKIDKRLISKSDSMEDKFVIRFADSNGAQFGCDDTRCASVDESDLLTLSCKRAWQYTGTDGYDCRFVSTEAAS